MRFFFRFKNSQKVTKVSGESTQTAIRLFRDNIKCARVVGSVVKHLTPELQDFSQSIDFRKRKPVRFIDGDANVYPDEDPTFDAFTATLLSTPLVVF